MFSIGVEWGHGLSNLAGPSRHERAYIVLHIECGVEGLCGRSIY